MAGNITLINVPRDVSNKEVLSRFLSRLVEQLDIAFGYRAQHPFAGATEVTVDLTQTIAALKSYANSGDSVTLASAKGYADAQDSTTLASAQTYADTGDSTTLASAQTYADTGDSTTLAAAQTYADTGDSTTLASAKSYADTRDATTLASAKTYADTGDSTTLAAAQTYADTNFTQNPQQSAIADLAYTAPTMSATYDQTEVQGLADQLKSVSDKLDAILAALRLANIITT